MAVSKNAIRKAGHLACLRETSNFSRASFQGTFFGSWVFEVKIKRKNLKGTKSRACEKFDM